MLIETRGVEAQSSIHVSNSVSVAEPRTLLVDGDSTVEHV
jgi:hypothetical protein